MYKINDSILNSTWAGSDSSEILLDIMLWAWGLVYMLSKSVGGNIALDTSLYLAYVCNKNQNKRLIELSSACYCPCG